MPNAQNITPLVSVALGPNEDAKDAVVTEGGDALPVAGKLLVTIANEVPAVNRQAWVGSLKNVLRHTMNEVFRKGHTTDILGFGHWQHACAGNITINTDGTNAAETDVFVTVSSTFPQGTQFIQETFDQALNVLIERSKDN